MYVLALLGCLEARFPYKAKGESWSRPEDCKGSEETSQKSICLSKEHPQYRNAIVVSYSTSIFLLEMWTCTCKSGW